MMSRHSRCYFGTDGIRGKVGKEPITPGFFMRLGYAVGVVLWEIAGFEESAARPSIIIGKDTRLSGYMLESALQAGFSAAGVDVYLSGPIPTPAIAYLTKALRLSLGVVISASHNVFTDNGIKFFSEHGDKLSDEVELSIERQLDSPMVFAKPNSLGRVYRISDATGRYIEFCKSTFPDHLNLRGVRLVVDCANGASYHTAIPVFQELGAEVIPLSVSPNGLNINESCGTIYPEHARSVVLDSKADYGVVVDGDADRLLIIDASGRIFNGDELLYAIVVDRQVEQSVSGVVGTQMSNLGLERAFLKQRIPFFRSRVGDRYVLEALREKNWLYGGESSGHILCLDRHSTGDATISALQIFSALQRRSCSLSELCADLHLFPQVLVNLPLSNGLSYFSSPKFLDIQQLVRDTLGNEGRVLVRPSGTESVLRVMVESVSESLAKSQAQKLVNAIEEELNIT